MIEEEDKGIEIIRRIKALLKKAESTEFQAEADLFVSKAHELMLKHAVEASDLHEEDKGKLVKAVVTLKPPFIRAKGYLLGAIVRNSGCFMLQPHRVRGKYADHDYWVYGREFDLEYVKGLFGSLLVQSIRFMGEDEPIDFEETGTTAKAWRNNYLLGYGDAIRNRLSEASKHVAEETKGPGVSLVLANKRTVAERFALEVEKMKKAGKGTAYQVTTSQGRGAGRAAGSKADLGTRRVGSRRAING